MKPSWMESDHKAAQERKERVVARLVGTKNTERDDDLDREESYQDLMEGTGRYF